MERERILTINLNSSCTPRSIAVYPKIFNSNGTRYLKKLFNQFIFNHKKISSQGRILKELNNILCQEPKILYQEFW